MNDRAKQAWSQVKSALLPCAGGMTVAIVASVMGANVTWKTWLYWGLIFPGIMLSIFLLSYWITGRKR